MLHKMYLVSPEYLNKQEPTTVPQKSPPKTVHKTRAHVKRKKKQPPHQYDKWNAVRGKIAEAAVERKALIKAITDLLIEVLPKGTPVNAPKRESVDLGTQTVTDHATPTPTYETPISSTRFEGPSDDDAGDVSEDVHKFATKSFGAVSSPYLSPFVHKRGVLDIEYGLRKEGNKFL
jgi:hypothetical protein